MPAPKQDLYAARARYVADLLAHLNRCTMKQALAEYDRLPHESACDDWVIAELGRSDLFFLMHQLLWRPDIGHPWLYARCRELEADPYEHLDLWARSHYKSSLLTFACGIQDVLRDPELCTGIFSHTRPKAKDFLRQIKQELENNEDLQDLYADVLWKEPRKTAPIWSEDHGLVVKRKQNPAEASFEAWGLIDSMPTGKHFGKLVYDDIVTEQSVTSPEIMKKTTDQLALSFNLGREGAVRQFIGTRYHMNDSYRTLIDRKTVKVRLHPCTANGKLEKGVDGVLMDFETLAKMRRDMGQYIFEAQMMLNPRGDETQGFKREWLRHYKNAQSGRGMNVYILVDPANSKRKKSDYTAIMVVGLGPDSNYYILDMVRDRLNLTQRTQRLMELHRKWQPQDDGVRYEEYGMQADIQHIESVQESANYRFKITPVGGGMHKADRINRLIPLYEQGKVWMMVSLHVTNVEGEVRDLVHDFIEDEYMAWPVPVHEDLLDAFAQITDSELPLRWPAKKKDFGNIMPAYVSLDPGVGM
jgi:phage terminase large subunit-like protein